MTFLRLHKLFPNDKAVIDYFIKIRYTNNHNDLLCPHCGSKRLSQRRDDARKFQCNSCNNSFSIFTNTIFENTKVSLVKWFFAIHLFLNSKKGISGYQLQREIGGSYKTSWRMLQQIRIAMGNNKLDTFFDAVIEIDETYVGGKPRKSNDKSLNTNKRGRGTNKTPVVGLINRDSSQVYAKVAMPNILGKKLTGNQLLGILNEVSRGENVVITDEFRSYRVMNRYHIHFVIDHTKSYADGDVHVNNVESFWAILKRGILGIYHHVSVKYLQRYVDEFCFRFNNRGLNMFDMVLVKGVINIK